MPTCTIHEPPAPPADRIDRAEQLVFVRDGFSWLAFLFAPIWLLAHRLWWAFLAYVVAALILDQILAFAGMPGSPLGVLALNLIVGFEADSLRRWGLARRGWRLLGSITGRNLDDCERHFFERWVREQPIIAAPGLQVAGGLR